MVSKVDICNMALSMLGNNGNINDIDNPQSDIEKTFSIWYESVRRIALKKTAPNFARARALLPLSKYVPEYGYTSAFESRNDCIKVLGVGNLCDINQYSIEGDYILVDYDADALPIRYIKDIKDTTKMDVLFVDYFACLLASKVASDISANAQTIQYVEQKAAVLLNNFISVDRQENKPIRIFESALLSARQGNKIVRVKK